MNANQVIKDAIEMNPEIRLVLEIATRAREAEARELPREIGSATEVVAIPLHSQGAL